MVERQDMSVSATPTGLSSDDGAASVSTLRASIPDVVLDAWLVENCGRGLPHGEVTDLPGALHALAYVHRQIASTSSYKVHIGQCIPAETGLLWVLRYLAAQAIEARRAETGTGSVEDESAVPEACANPNPDTRNQANG